VTEYSLLTGATFLHGGWPIKNEWSTPRPLRILVFNVLNLTGEVDQVTWNDGLDQLNGTVLSRLTGYTMFQKRCRIDLSIRH
jgi:hypothetical protein